MKDKGLATWAKKARSGVPIESVGKTAVAVQNGGLAKNVLVQYPSGRWGFSGSVHSSLKYANLDGTPVSDATLKEIQGSSNPAMMAKARGVKTLSFETKEAALEHAKLNGQEVTGEHSGGDDRPRDDHGRFAAK